MAVFVWKQRLSMEGIRMLDYSIFWDAPLSGEFIYSFPAATV